MLARCGPSYCRRHIVNRTGSTSRPNSSFPSFPTATTYGERLRAIGIFLLCYWHEYLNLVFSSILSNDVNVSIRTITRMTRNANPVNGILLNVSQCICSFKNNFYVGAPSVWNILPSNIRDTSKSIAYFKNSLFNYYLNLLEHIYNPRQMPLNSISC